AQLPVPTATSFAVVGAAVDEDRLVADYLRAMAGFLAALAASESAVACGLHVAVAERCLTLGAEVEVSLPDGTALRGRATRLESDGRLIVDSGGSEHPIAAGDVIHARLA